MTDAAYISYDLPDSLRVRSVEDPSHQHWLDRVPHNLGDGVRLQVIHHVITERSCRARLRIIYVIHAIEIELGEKSNLLSHLNILFSSAKRREY